MKLSRKGQYAVKAMMNLTINYNYKPVTLTEVSKSDSISISYLEQLFSILKRSGLVQGVRGPGGGYRLAKSPDQISIAEIIFSVEEPNINSYEQHHESCKKSEACMALSMWNEFSDQLASFLGSISLADVIKDHVIVKRQFHIDETTRRISTMFPVTDKIKVA